MTNEAQEQDFKKQEQALKKIKNKILDLYASGHLRPGANKILTRMNGIKTTITVYIKDESPIGINAWV
jgi:hypothetical protein